MSKNGVIYKHCLKSFINLLLLSFSCYFFLCFSTVKNSKIRILEKRMIYKVKNLQNNNLNVVLIAFPHLIIWE